MQLRYGSLITLGGTQLTEEGRGPLREERDERAEEVQLASGKIKKYIKSVKRSWNVSWDNVSESNLTTIDNKGGRNEIRSLAMGGAPLALVIQDGHNTAENYTVFVTDYSEELVMRLGVWRYKVDLSLKEQG